MEYIVYAVLAFAAFAFVYAVFFKKVTVMEYEEGVVYKDGKFLTSLPPGKHWISPFGSRVELVDTRERVVTVPGQEIISADGVTLKVSLVAKYQVAAPEVALNKVQNFHEALYIELQLALRKIIGELPVEELIENRDGFPAKLSELTSEPLESIGIKLLSADLKDLLFPGQLKQMFAQVVQARKESQALLEKARGESAAFRSLANIANLVEKNPGMLQLRAIQAITESQGNTLVFGLPAQNVPLTTKSVGSKRNEASESSGS